MLTSCPRIERQVDDALREASLQQIISASAANTPVHDEAQNRTDDVDGKACCLSSQADVEDTEQQVGLHGEFSGLP